MIRTYTKEYGLPQTRVLPSGEKQEIFNSVTMVYRSSRYDANHEDRFINAGLYRDTREVVELEFSPKLLNTGFVIPKIKRSENADSDNATAPKKDQDQTSRKRKHFSFQEEGSKGAKKRALIQGTSASTTPSKDRRAMVGQASSLKSSSKRSQKQKASKRKQTLLPSTTGRNFSKLIDKY